MTIIINEKEYGTGLIPSLPDFRDYTIYHPYVKPFFDTIGVTNLVQNPLLIPTFADNSSMSSPVEDQGVLNSCVAHATSSALEYLENVVYNSDQAYTDASRLYLYKRSRMLSGIIGDGGAYIRDTLKVMSTNGAPPEDCWQYNVLTFDDDLSLHPTCDRDAKNYQIINYVRLDDGSDSQTVLNNIRANVSSGQSVITGVDLYSVLYLTIPGIGDYYFPCPDDNILGRHAMLIVGYDDNRVITNPLCTQMTTVGAFLAKNSYGKLFGYFGYVWIPYDFLIKSKMYDVWTIAQIVAPKNTQQHPIDLGFLYIIGAATGVMLLLQTKKRRRQYKLEKKFEKKIIKRIHKDKLRK